MNHGSSTVLGIDLGTSGVRVAIADRYGVLIHTASMPYAKGIESSKDWKECCKRLIKDLPSSLRNSLVACAVDGTSGTLLACDKSGEPLGEALPYFINCLEQKSSLKKLLSDKNSHCNTNSSLARALRLVDRFGPNLLIRHQADWISGWLMGNWQWGEEGNNLRLGWDLITQSWPENFKELPWHKGLPEIVPSGSVLSKISPKIAKNLDLPEEMQIVAGTTDSNASVLAANANPKEAITILGSTIVLKSFVNRPLQGIGITNHRIGGRWICGGSSNAGGAVLRKLFTDQELEELSRQINPNSDSGLNLRPLPFIGERFPINDPTMEPILEPRPVSDSLYLHALFEGLAKIEAQGWHRLIELGVPAPKQIITLGGGAKNPQWRRLRERAIGLPIKTCKSPPALGVAHLALQSIAN